MRKRPNYVWNYICTGVDRRSSTNMHFVSMVLTLADIQIFKRSCHTVLFVGYISVYTLYPIITILRFFHLFSSVYQILPFILTVLSLLFLNYITLLPKPTRWMEFMLLQPYDHCPKKNKHGKVRALFIYI